MQMNHATFANSRALRVSLKRGIARQSIATAERSSADLPELFRLAAGLRPSRKGLERMASRIKDQPGVVRVALTGDRKALVFVSRVVREIEAKVEGEECYRETGLIYLRARVGLDRGHLTFRLSAASFCVHALERLVERSALPLDRSLLPEVDSEARHIFQCWDTGRLIEDSGDQYYPAATAGIWAGGYDRMEMEDDWGLFGRGNMKLPVFSARTFLGEAEMRPVVWLRWRNDPNCRMI